MTKLLKNIQSTRGPRHLFIHDPMVQIEQDVTDIRYEIDSYLYRIDVRIGYTVASPLEMLDESKKQVQREIANYVYGDQVRALREWFFGQNISKNISRKKYLEFFNILEEMEGRNLEDDRR